MRATRCPSPAPWIVIAFATTLFLSCDEFSLYESFDTSASLTSTRPDYQVINSSPPGWGMAGAALGSGSFAIEEVTGNAGTETIAWGVFLSSDESLDIDDIALTSGTAQPLAGNANATIEYWNTAVWPDQPGYYYLFVAIAAADDVNTANDRNTPAVASHIPVAGREIDEDWATNNDSPGFQDLGIFEDQDLVRINGSMDSPGGNDTYQISLSTDSSPRKIEVTVVWSGGDAIDVAVADESFTSTAGGREPGVFDKEARVVGLFPGDSHMIQVIFKDVASPTYRLFISTTK